MGWQFPAARRAAGHQRLLAAAGAALLAAPDAAAVHRVAAEATAGLLGLDAPAELAGDPELVPDEARDALESLRAQVTLALGRAELAAEVARRASVDPLTGLANRTAFSRRLQEALGTLEGAGPAAPALLLLDLDDFKTINDSLGHSSGDEVLWVVAERLRGCLGPATWRPGPAATSSPCSSPRSPTRARRSPSASGWRPSSAAR